MAGDVIYEENGCLKMRQEASSFVLSAEEIYGVAFEGRNEVRSVSLNVDSLRATGLQFIKLAADPTVVVTASLIGNTAIIECHFVAKAFGFEAEVARDGLVFLDYAVGSGKWIPLPNGSAASARAFLNRLAISDFGRISLAKYLEILRSRESALLIEDRTHQLLRAASVAASLGGRAPDGFAGTLYPYQLGGFQWLSYMSRNGLGSIIADEMGLGKTIQVICLLLEAKQESLGPSVVIAPATLLVNWRRELTRFGPELTILDHHGPRRTGFPQDLQTADVVLTSFETAVADVSLLRNVSWNLLIVDEAQNIKNPSAKRSIQLRTIPRRCAIAATGTPFENHLTDLWSISDFVQPSLLGSLREFERVYPDSVTGAAALEPVITPLMLRRRVIEVAGDLPPRIDIPQPLELDPGSSEIYESLRNSASGGGGSSLASLTNLRMFCTHPWLAGQYTQIASAVECSVKLQRLLEILEEIVSSGEKALVFTSYQQSVDILSSEIAATFGIHTDFIDGRVPISDRQSIVDRFTAHGGAGALVLNPKAAGTGLNITAANHVVHYNLEWNPAVEDQASARAYRRGQVHPVTVHRLFYVDTVEDVINDRMTHKRDIGDAAVIGTDGSKSDVQDILRALRASPMHKGWRIDT
jgi:SNF2 family DNA or RNA helicase